CRRNGRPLVRSWLSRFRLGAATLYSSENLAPGALVNGLKAVKANLDRMAHQMALPDWSAGSMSNYRQCDVVACIEREAAEGSKFTTSKWFIPLAPELALDGPVFSASDGS